MSESLLKELTKAKRTIIVFYLKGKEYIPVSTEETLPTLREADFNNEVYAPRYGFDFVKSLMHDRRTVDKLHQNITDGRPMIFDLLKDEKDLKEKKQEYGGEVLCGDDWKCLVTHCADAWVILVMNYDA